MEIVVRPDLQSVAEDAAERVVSAAERAISQRAVFTFVLAGGSTPAKLYELLASVQYSARIDWTRIQVFFGDERCVAPDHEWSNFAMARRTLLGLVPILPWNVHRIPSVMPADEAAITYSDTIRQALPLGVSLLPRFDLVLLGMGDDGHTASLFPGMPALDELHRWVVGTAVPQYVRPQVARVTLTFPVLNEAREVLFLVTGAAKAEAVSRVLQGAGHDPGAAALPAAQVRPHDGALTWLLDLHAASLMKAQ